MFGFCSSCVPSPVIAVVAAVPAGRAYPSPSGEGVELSIQQGVQEFLGPTNKRLMEEAKNAFNAGDAERIGE
jgi:hypothetical protein